MKKKYIAAGAAAAVVTLMGFSACTEDTNTTSTPTPTVTATPTSTPPTTPDEAPFDVDAILTATEVCTIAAELSQDAASGATTDADIHRAYEVVAARYHECEDAMRSTLPSINVPAMHDAVTDIADTAGDVADWAGAGWPGTEEDINELGRRIQANAEAFQAGTEVAQDLTVGDVS